MAYDKIIPVRKRLDHCVDYVLNREKTDLSAVLGYIGNTKKNTLEQTVLETAVNCKLETAYADMMATKRRWGKPGGVLGYHLIHSFVPGEVTPMQAHELGLAFATRLLGERYEFVVSTHLDHDHLHCHILFNSVSFVDGRKYRDDFSSYFGDIRGISNEVSRESGLSVITPENSGQHYAEWEAEKRGNATVRGLIRQDIDAAISGAFTYKSFWAALERLGYEVKRGESVKHTAVKPPGGARFIRLSSLGDGYTEDAIRERLAAGRTGELPKAEIAPPKPRRYTVQRGSIRQTPRRKLRGFRALYVYYLYLLGKRPPARPRKRPVPFAVRKEVTRLHRYQRQFRLLQKNRIDTAAQLSMLGDALQAEIDAQTGNRKELYHQKRQGAEVTTEIQQINGRLRQLRRELKTYTQIVEDIPHIHQQVETVRQEQVQEQQQIKQRKKEVFHDGR